MRHHTCRPAWALAAALPILSGLALAQTEIPQVESFAGPAVAQLNGTTYVAFGGINSLAEGHRVWYTTLGGTQTDLGFYTRTPPALAAARGTLYLAARGNAPSGADSIYYSSLDGSKLTAPNTAIPSAQTTAAPSLEGDSSTLFAAWTTASGTIEYASYTGSWSTPQPTPGVTKTGLHPSLAVYNGSLYMAWINASTDAIMYASLSLTDGSWSAANAVGSGAASGAPPSLAVFNATFTTNAGLYIAWTTGSDINAWKYDTVARVFTLGPVSPGPTSFAPALLSSAMSCPAGLVGTTYSLEVFYTSGPEGDIFLDHLLPGGKCYAPPPPCKGEKCH